jgi:patatin-related protein
MCECRFTVTHEVSSAPGPDERGGNGTRELRLAIVLYGGVSLAIYMHGTTKEIHRLVRASAADDLGLDVDEGTPTELVYRRLLQYLADRHPRKCRTRVVVDVIAGTSAGGINGVYLAKALVHNRSQDGLRDVWIQRGAIGKLLRGWSWVPWQVRAPGLLMLLPFMAPLKGRAMSGWLYDALEAMDNDPRPAGGPTLMPEGHRLDLFITATDFYGYDRDVVISSPTLVNDHAHRHVLSFRSGDGRDDFTSDDNAWLALAGRVTSSIPGAFPPVSLSEFEASFGGLRDPQRFFRIYELSDAKWADTTFVDGGVLDNRPFGHAIRAIRSRAAESEVDRCLVYVDPDPAHRRARDDAPPVPRPLASILSAAVGLPRQEPILDDILEVSRHNERVERIRDIIELAFPKVAERVESVVDPQLTELVGVTAADTLGSWRDALNEDAQAAVGVGYATYLRSKVSGVVDRYARTICDLSDYPEDCNQAVFVRATLRAWARARLFEERDGRPAPQENYVVFLRRFDLDYGIRRMRFVIDALSWWYRDVGEPDVPTRAELDCGKAAFYETQSELVDAAAGRGLGVDLTDLVTACFSERVVNEWVGRPGDYVSAHATELARLERSFGDALDSHLKGVGERMFDQVQRVMQDWSPRVRRDLLIRYLGFPLWDAILYPIQAVADVGERDKIDVVRFSPENAAPLDVLEPKLSGVERFHFGAFFEPAGRERDYLWGRLDGAAHLIGMLLGKGATQAERTEWCREVFAAIAQEEEEHLPKAASLLADVRAFATSSAD